MSVPVLGDDFKCADGSATISSEWVNDDYCDCPDGSDETKTSACPGGTFVCANPGHASKTISSSLVGDTICDCCDGTDEAEGVCQNTCDAVAAKARADAAREAAVLKEGLRVKAEYVKKGSNALVQSQALKTAAEVALKKAEDEVTSVQSRMEHEENLEREEADAKKQELVTAVAAAVESANLSAADLSDIVSALAFDKREDGIHNLHSHLSSVGLANVAVGELVKLFTDGDAAVDAFKSEAVRKAENMLELQRSFERSMKGETEADDSDSNDNQELDIDADGTVGGGTVPTDGAEGKEEEGEEEAKAPPPGLTPQQQERQRQVIEKLEAKLADAKSEEEDEKRIMTTSFRNEFAEKVGLAGMGSTVLSSVAANMGSDLGSTATLLDLVKVKAPAAADALSGLTSPENAPRHVRPEAEVQRQAKSKADAAKADATRDLADANDAINTDYGKDREWYPLANQCFKMTKGEFEYSVCPFDSAKQGHTSLGNWDGFRDDYTKMQFDRGAWCGVVSRSREATVILKCGVADAVVAVEEPETCKYELTLETPAAC